MERIASRDNEQVKYARKLATSAAFRRQEGSFFAEGRRLCMDLADTLRPQAAFFTEAFLKKHPEAATLGAVNCLISQPVDDKLRQTQSPQGLYCLFPIPAVGWEDLIPARGVLLCESLQDPANVGAVLRSAAAFGFGGVVLAGESADPYGPKALRAGMGSAGRIPVLAGVSLGEAVEALRRQGAKLVAAALDEQAQPVEAVRPNGPFALLVGNEGAGLTPAALAAADTTVYIPMHHGVESLNAAVAASVLMYQLAAAREGAEQTAT